MQSLELGVIHILVLFFPCLVSEVAAEVSFTKLLLYQISLAKYPLVPSSAPQHSTQGPYSSSPASAPAPAPYNSRAIGPKTLPWRHNGRYHRHRRHRKHPAVAPSPPSEQGCPVCIEPLASTTFGSPCGCVLPMRIQILLSVAPYAFFPVTRDLEVEVADSIRLQQSQVRIMGAEAYSQNPDLTMVEIYLVPLGEKFDNTTALLIAENFLNNSIRLNASLFGSYRLINISYPGIASSPFGDISGGHPAANGDMIPLTARIASKNRMKMSTAAIICLSVAILVAAFTAAVFFILRWRTDLMGPTGAVGGGFASSTNWKRGTHSALSSNVTSLGALSVTSAIANSLHSVKMFSLACIEKATDAFSSRRILGEGGFGRVYHGVMDDGTDIAVKLLLRDNRSGDQEFIAEVEMLSKLHHRNLVKLLGICIEKSTRCLVYELVRNGSVESHLHGADYRRSPLSWDARLKIALGAARGLAYLHEESNPHIIHRDFKGSNILLEEDFTPKVSDFGLAKEANEGDRHISTRVMGTFGYVAPEYAMTGHLLVKSDVYSYGVVLLELLTGRKPVDMARPHGQENLVTWARPLLTNKEGIEKLLDPSLAAGYNFGDVAKVAAVASMCIHLEVTSRPFMGEVVQALKLVCNVSDETGGDYVSQLGSSMFESECKGDLAESDCSWWYNDGPSPFNTRWVPCPLPIEYSFSPNDMSQRFSDSGLVRDRSNVATRHFSLSGPLRRLSKPPFCGPRWAKSEDRVHTFRHDDCNS